jgi:acetolactate synthase-1/2/3 large subunit
MTQPSSDAPAPAAPPDSQPLTGAQILWTTLVREGVKVVFGSPGGAIMPAYDRLAPAVSGDSATC